MKKPTVKVESHTAYKSENHILTWGSCGWAIYNIDELTGVFSIVSDHGDFSYRWNTGALGGKKLKEFICECDSEYLTEKMARSYKDKFDNKETCEALKDRLLEFLVESTSFFCNLIPTFA